MDKVISITGTAVPLDRSDVDTDQIIPSDWLKRVERTGFEKGLFSEWRDDRDFVLNQEQYVGAVILIAGPNFGTGSSREHAVWALQQYGFQAVVSSRFGPIFRNNASKNGLVCVEVDEPIAEALLTSVAAQPDQIMTIDVATKTLSAPGADVSVEFPLDDSIVHRLLEGLDDIGLTLQHEPEITTFEATRPEWMPVTS
jgi:3-isopropylmalate/(R)-2-methylmalate dehydratase small subunit